MDLCPNFSYNLFLSSARLCLLKTFSGCSKRKLREEIKWADGITERISSKNIKE
jgi:hypothetical protein